MAKKKNRGGHHITINSRQKSGCNSLGSKRGEGPEFVPKVGGQISKNNRLAGQVKGGEGRGVMVKKKLNVSNYREKLGQQH